MSFWVYKCNSDQHDHQKNWGDWEPAFEASEPFSWGAIEDCDQLKQLQVGDVVIAHQSNKQMLVGIAEVNGFEKSDKKSYVMLNPIETIRADMKELKDLDKRIASLQAYQQGLVQTIYKITTADALHLIDVARRLRDLNTTIDRD